MKNHPIRHSINSGFVLYLWFISDSGFVLYLWFVSDSEFLLCLGFAATPTYTYTSSSLYSFCLDVITAFSIYDVVAVLFF